MGKVSPVRLWELGPDMTWPAEEPLSPDGGLAPCEGAQLLSN
jgi:hypothetical protein